jgi:thioredoxin reductase
LSRHTIAIIGAGPYGLSIAAHLRFHGVDFRIFGVPMQSWREHMPEGMFLKSEGDASNLFSPGDGSSLGDYCAKKNLPYEHQGKPVSLEVFTQYGLDFQEHFVPSVETTLVTSVRRSSTGFELQLSSGETLTARKVVVATGIAHAQNIPAELRHLPSERLSHSGSHHSLSQFSGRNVAVIGGGQSAIETAAILHESGAQTQLIVRKQGLAWNSVPNLGSRSVRERIRRPMSKLGPGLGPWLYSNLPMVFRHLPEATRIGRVKRALGPAGAWWLAERVQGRVPILLGHAVSRAEVTGEKVVLSLKTQSGERSQLTVDHVVAATGYRFAVGSVLFLSESIVAQVHSVQQTPVLSSNFESSVPGLYFTGLASANQFGPAMRFLHGAKYTSERVSRHILRDLRHIGVSRAEVQNQAAKYQES